MHAPNYPGSPRSWLPPQALTKPEAAAPAFGGLLNPSAQPNWREIRVKDLIQKPKNRHGISRGPLRSRDDWSVFVYHQFLSGFLVLEDEDENFEHCSQFPEIFLAHVMRHEALYERHVQLEARVLARLSPEEIGKDLHMSAEVVEWYERLFFDVRERFDSMGWISQVIHGPYVDQAVAPGPGISSPARRAAFLRLMAFCGGPLILRFLEIGLPQLNVPKTADDVSGWMDQVTRLAISRQSAQAAHFFDVNKLNITELLNIHCRTLEYSQRERLSAKNKSQDQEDLAALMVPFVKEIRATMDEEVLQMPQLEPQARRYLQTSMEPRAKDWLNMAGTELMALEAADTPLDKLNDPEDDQRVKAAPVEDFVVPAT